MITLIEGVTAGSVLRKDHEVINDLFEQAEDAVSDRLKKIIGDRCLRELEVHALLESRIFYPAVRRDLGEDELVAQALAEHASAQRIVGELKRLPAGERYNDRFRALRDIVIAHIEEEEAGLLVRVERSDMDVEQLGLHMLALKRRVETAGPDDGGFRSAFGVAAGVVLVGSVAWLASRFIGRRRAST